MSSKHQFSVNTQISSDSSTNRRCLECDHSRLQPTVEDGEPLVREFGRFVGDRQIYKINVLQMNYYFVTSL